MQGYNFCSVKCEDLSGALVRMEEANLDHCKLTAEQVISLFQAEIARLCSHWSSSYITALLLAESFRVLLCQLSYAIKNQLVASKAPY